MAVRWPGPCSAPGSAFKCRQYASVKASGLVRSHGSVVVPRGGGAPALAPRQPLLMHRRAPAPTIVPRSSTNGNGSGVSNSSSNGNGSSSSSTNGSSTPSTSSSGSEEPAAAAPSLVDRMLLLPLLLSSALSHVNRQYIRARRRRRWWSKLAYPKVPSEAVDHLPEPAVELWRKVLPLGLIFFAASFNLTVLQSLKDSVVVVAGGAETLPYLTSLCVLPASIGFFVLYGKLVSALPERAVFYAAVAPLLAAYALFAAVVYPAAPALHFDLSAVAAALPAGLHGLVKVFANWTYSAFFCAAELWGSVVISVLFWSLANDTVTVDEAKVVYPFMAIGANVALVAGGVFVRAVNAALPAGAPLLGMRVLVGAVVAMSAVMFAAKAFIDARILAPMEAAAAAAAAKEGGAADGAGAATGKPEKKEKKEKKKKGSFAESIAVLRSSPKIGNLALLVMGYGVAHRLFEFAWKGQLRVLHPTVQGYQSVLADVSTYTGITTLASMVVSRLIFQHLGWGVAASVTPVVMGLAGTTFFAASILGGGAVAAAGTAGTATAWLVGAGAVAGVVTQVFARASKYSLFDPAKEMVFIEMDREEKKRGKAAVDLVGSQIGKSGASWITQAFLLATGSMAAAMPFTGAAFALVVVTWVRATWGLHRSMQETEAARAAAAAAAGGDAGPAVSIMSADEDGGGASGGATPLGAASPARAASPAAAEGGNGNGHGDDDARAPAPVAAVASAAA